MDQKQLSDILAAIQAQSATLNEIKPVVLDLAKWKPEVEQAVGKLQADIGDLRTQVFNLTAHRSEPAIDIYGGRANQSHTPGARIFLSSVVTTVTGNSATARLRIHGGWLRRGISPLGHLRPRVCPISLHLALIPKISSLLWIELLGAAISLSTTLCDPPSCLPRAL